MAVDGTLIFDTKIDTKNFSTGANTIKAQAGALKNALLSLGKTIGVVFGVAQLIKFGKEAVNMASDLQEVQNVVDTAFGSMAYKMEDFAKTSIETFGISQLTAKETGSTYMAMARGMGLAIDTASDMSISLTGLSADMASFYNVSQDVAKTALSSIFTGETETLKRYGIVMTQTNLQAFAMSKGLKGNISDMGQAQQTLLRYQYVMSQTALAQGDFAKTSDSWANQTRILSEQWKQFLGIVGQGLIQVLTPVVRTISTAMSYLIKFATVVSSVLSNLFGIEQQAVGTAATIESIGSGASDASTGLSDMGKAAKKAAKDSNKSTSSIDKFNTVTEDVAKSSEDAANSLADMGGFGGIDLGTSTMGEPDTSALEKGMINTINAIKTQLQPLFDAFDRLKLAVAPFAKNIGSGLKWFLDNVLIPLGKWTISKLLPSFLDLLGAGIGLLNTVIEVFKPYGIWLWENFLKPIATWTGALIIEGLKLLTEGLNNLSTWILNNQGTIANAAIVIGSFFAAFKIAELIVALTPLLTTFASFISSGGLLSSVLAGISTILSALTAPVVLITAVLGLLIVSFIDLYNNSQKFRDQIVELGETWKTALQPLADFIGTVLKDAWEQILQPVIEFFINTLLPQLIETFKNLWEKVLVPFGTFIGTVLQPVFKILSDVLMMLWKDVILPLAKAVGETLKNAWNAFYEIMNKTVLPILGTVISTVTKLWKNILLPIVDVLWRNVKPAFDTVFKGIGGVIDGLKTTLNGIITFITGVFTGNWKKAWEGVKSIFKGIFDAFVSIVKVPFNLIIDIINGLIDGIVAGINTVVKAINTLNFKVPDWIPGIGGNEVGFSLKPITAPKIPKFATGTVVPANFGEFVGILGDNKKEPEVVSPLSTIEQAVTNAMSKLGGAAGNINLNVYLDGKQIHSEVVKQDQKYSQQTGHSAFAY